MKNLPLLAEPEQRPRKLTRGFTLIELLIVIAIISILAAILFPVFSRARENARRSSCQSNQKNMALSIMQYTQDFDERLPYHWTDNVTLTLQWQYTIQPYVKNRQIFFCPSAPTKDSGVNLSQGNIAYGYNYIGLNGRLLADVQKVSETLMLGDTGLNAVSYVIDPVGSSGTRKPNDIHLEVCNFAFVDGHVKWMKAGPVVAAYGTANSLWDLQ